MKVLLGATIAALVMAGCLPLRPAPPLILDQPPVTAPVRLGQPGMNQYAAVTVDALRRRTYGAGELRIVEELGVTANFTRTLISYTSDGLTIYGFMNTPFGDGPFPVVIVNHGYVDPNIYSTLTYTTRYADALAAAGYLAIHPNFRDYPPSDSGLNPLRAGSAIDVLNLVGLVERLGGQPGPLEKADPDAIGLWGHSMGGGISLRVLVVSDAVDAAVLYGAMSGDEVRNHDRILNVFSGGIRGLWDEETAPSEELLRQVSPIYHLEKIAAAVSIHHGDLDDQVPLSWSEELCASLNALEKDVECFTYAGQPHTFVGEGDRLFIERTVAFFDRTLRRGTP